MALSRGSLFTRPDPVRKDLNVWEFRAESKIRSGLPVPTMMTDDAGLVVPIGIFSTLEGYSMHAVSR